MGILLKKWNSFRQVFKMQRDRVKFFHFLCAAYSHSPGSYESTGTKILKKFDQKVGQTDSLRISFIYNIYTNEILSEPF